MNTRPFGADGRLKLRNALFAGAAVQGVPRALSFGVGSTVAAPKRIAVRSGAAPAGPSAARYQAPAADSAG